MNTKKYIIELEDIGNGLYRAKGANTLVFDEHGIENILTPYKEEEEEKFPKDLDKYYYIDSSSSIYSKKFDHNCVYDITRLSIGNCFKTREEAEFAIERLKVLAEMKKFAKPKDMAWDGENTGHFYICYDSFRKCFVIDNKCILKDGNMFFESFEKAQECINTVGEYRIKKYYLCIPD